MAVNKKDWQRCFALPLSGIREGKWHSDAGHMLGSHQTNYKATWSLFSPSHQGLVTSVTASSAPTQSSRMLGISKTLKKAIAAMDLQRVHEKAKGSIGNTACTFEHLGGSQDLPHGAQRKGGFCHPLTTTPPYEQVHEPLQKVAPDYCRGHLTCCGSCFLVMLQQRLDPNKRSLHVSVQAMQLCGFLSSWVPGEQTAEGKGREKLQQGWRE